jgi:hypothetical protein
MTCEVCMFLNDGIESSCDVYVWLCFCNFNVSHSEYDWKTTLNFLDCTAMKKMCIMDEP